MLLTDSLVIEGSKRVIVIGDVGAFDALLDRIYPARRRAPLRRDLRYATTGMVYLFLAQRGRVVLKKLLGPFPLL